MKKVFSNRVNKQIFNKRERVTRPIGIDVRKPDAK